MRTVGIWISGLLASAIAGGFIGSTFDTVYGDGHGTSDERHVCYFGWSTAVIFEIIARTLVRTLDINERSLPPLRWAQRSATRLPTPGRRPRRRDHHKIIRSTQFCPDSRFW
jgi:hypothetical protein